MEEPVLLALAEIASTNSIDFTQDCLRQWLCCPEYPCITEIRAQDGKIPFQFSENCWNICQMEFVIPSPYVNTCNKLNGGDVDILLFVPHYMNMGESVESGSRRSRPSFLDSPNRQPEQNSSMSNHLEPSSNDIAGYTYFHKPSEETSTMPLFLNVTTANVHSPLQQLTTPLVVNDNNQGLLYEMGRTSSSLPAGQSQANCPSVGLPRLTIRPSHLQLGRGN
ncbi:hypothetical protein VNO77_02866 [Canavalia gladiata]|uniref:Uncharacterized protein n=1 Tax=Canavalia gladiata TaxID=3824 RepID=A0AAN9MTQ6_CANGL